MTDHTLILTFDGDTYSPSVEVECRADSLAPCRARFSCDCPDWVLGDDVEAVDLFGTTEIIPTHGCCFKPKVATCTGRYDPAYCGVRAWVDDGGEAALTGKASIPVTVKYDDGYHFTAAGEISKVKEATP